MRAMTVPSTVVEMSEVEKSSANARAALPSAYMPDSASDSDSTAPPARMLTVLPPSMTAPVATWIVAVASAHATASASATCAPPGLGVLSVARDVLALMDADALASAVMTIALAAVSSASAMSTVAFAFACA